MFFSKHLQKELIFAASPCICFSIEKQIIYREEGTDDQRQHQKLQAAGQQRIFLENYGGSFVPPELQKVLDEITTSYLAIREDETFIHELAELNRHFTGRPSPCLPCKESIRKNRRRGYLS